MEFKIDDNDAEFIASKIADRVVNGDVLVEAIKGVVRVEVRESYQSTEFTDAVGGIVGNVFDNHMSELGKALDAINKRLDELEKT